jgi:hypothetical protein
MSVLKALVIVLTPGILLVGAAAQSPAVSQAPARADSATGARTFRVWVFSDAHVGSDLSQGRESLAIPLSQSEGPKGFDWDIALNLGDLSGAEGTPRDPEGQEVVRQYGVLTKHRREDVYDISGNHDRNGLDEPQAWWFRKWVDPKGEHTEFSRVDATKRRFPIDGTWERYAFRVGNLLFLMMSDINEPTQRPGRGPWGGNPGGVVSGETFRWWKRIVAENPNSIIISSHHYVLKNTTVASGEWEGLVRDDQGGWRTGYHGYFQAANPECTSFLCWVDSQKNSGAFENALASMPGSVDMWLGGHTHTAPDDTFGGKSHIERRWSTVFMNVAGLTKYHTAPGTGVPRSWLLTFTEGSDIVNVRRYLHGDEYGNPRLGRKVEAPQGFFPDRGVRHEPLGPDIKLSKPFHMPGQ